MSKKSHLGERGDVAIKAVKGTLFNAFELYFLRFLGFFINILLARYWLGPLEFGIVACAEAVFIFANSISDFGFDYALRSRKENVREAAETHRSVTSILGLLVFLFAVVLSFLTKLFFDEQVGDIQDAICILGIAFLLESTITTYRHIVEKEMYYNKLVKMRVAVQIVKYSVTLITAIYGQGFWSLLYGRLAEVLLKAIILPRISPYRIKFGFSRKILEDFKKYGPWGHYFFAGLCSRIYRKFDDLAVTIFARGNGNVALGFYQKSYSMANLPTETITHVLSRVAISTYCKVQDDRYRLSQAFNILMYCVLRTAWPLGVIFFLNAHDLIWFLYKEQWLPAVPIFQILSVYCLLRTIYDDCGSVFVAIRKPKVINNIQMLQAAMVLFGTPIMVYFFRDFGPQAYWTGIGAGLMIDLAMFICVILAYQATKKHVDIYFKANFLAPVVGTLIVIVVILSLEHFISGALYRYIASFVADCSDYIFGSTKHHWRIFIHIKLLSRICVKSLLGILLYLLTFMLIDKQYFTDTIKYIFKIAKEKQQ